MRVIITHLLACVRVPSQENDAFACAKVAQAVIRACWAVKDLEGLMEQVSSLCKKRGQSKRSTVAIVRQALRYVDALRDEGSSFAATAVELTGRTGGSGSEESKAVEDEEDADDGGDASASASSASSSASAASAGGGSSSSGLAAAVPSPREAEATREALEDKTATDHEQDAGPTEEVPRSQGAAVAAAGGKSCRDSRLALISCLREVTDGKIWVEVERARLTRALSQLHESEGRLPEACTTLQEAAVETINTMRTREKLELLLEQVRLCEAVGDWVRMSIIANKVQRRIIDRAEHEPRKLAYFRLLASLHQHRRDASALADDYEAVLECPSVAASEAAWKDALGRVAVFAALSPWTETLTARWHALLADKRLEQLPSHRQLLLGLVSGEMVPGPPTLPPLHDSPVFDGLAAPHTALSPSEAITTLVTAPAAAADAATSAKRASSSSWSSSSSSSASSSSSSSFSAAVRSVVAPGARWWGVLHRRLAQHNLRVAAASFSRVRFPRLCELTGLTCAVCEAELRDMVTAGDLWARIDRPAGIVVFRRQQRPAEVLSGWGGSLAKVLALVERTTHLIHKERMVQAAAAVTA